MCFIVEADKGNNHKSLDRALDSHLLLVTEQKYGSDFVWTCPHGKWVEGETMRQVYLNFFFKSFYN